MKFNAILAGIRSLVDELESYSPEPGAEPEPKFIVKKIPKNVNVRSLTHRAGYANGKHVSLTYEYNFIPSPRMWTQNLFLTFLDMTTGDIQNIQIDKEYAGILASNVRVLAHEDRVYLWQPHKEAFGLRFTEFVVDGDTASVVEDQIFYNYTDHTIRQIPAFYQLESNALVGLAYVFKPTVEGDLLVDIHYRSPQRAWSTQRIDMNDTEFGGGITSLRGYSIVQHPQGDIWIFLKRDSWHNVEAIHLKEIDNALVVQDIFPNFRHQMDEDYGPEGENPSIETIAMPDRNSILLAYQSNHFKIFAAGTQPDGSWVFIKGAWLAFVELAADGTVLGEFNLEQMQERLADFGMIYTPGKLWITHWNLTEDSGNTYYGDHMMYGSCYDFATGAWSSPTEISPLSSDGYNLHGMKHAEANGENPCIVFNTSSKIINTGLQGESDMLALITLT